MTYRLPWVAPHPCSSAGPVGSASPLPARRQPIAIWPIIAKENEARREASKFNKAKASEAAKAGTSMHKARQAIAVQKAIEAAARVLGKNRFLSLGRRAAPVIGILYACSTRRSPCLPCAMRDSLR